MILRIRNLVLLLIIPALWFAVGTAQAFKIDTHLWLASELYPELITGRVQLENGFGSYPIPSQIQKSLKAKGGREAFLIGVLGPDLYPDMIAGQMTTHPGLSLELKEEDITSGVKQLRDLLGTKINSELDWGWQTDDWLKHVQGSAKTPMEIAFAYGYLLHAAMDVWAHTYVNLYTGDLFSISDNMETAARHVAIENYIKNAHVKYDPKKEYEPSKDKFTDLQGPTRFIRETLILNPLAAYQYAHANGAEHIWVMYAIWDYAKRSDQTWHQIRRDLDRAVQQASAAVLSAEGIWQSAEAAKKQAAQAASKALTAKKNAERVAATQLTELNNAIDQALEYLNNLPGVSATRTTIENFISNLPSGWGVRQAYDNAKIAFNKADKARNDAVKAYQKDSEARYQAEQNAIKKFNDLDLKKQAKNAIKQARDSAWAVVDNSFNSWLSNIEAGVDAYIRAWEETAREIMRPAGDRFTKGHDVIWPLKEWAVCWGPVFGMPSGPVNPQNLAHGCQTTFKGFSDALENLHLLVINEAFDRLGLSQLKHKIVEMDEGLEELLRDALPVAGKIIADAIGEQAVVVQGSASFAAQMWEKEIDGPDLIIEFEDDGSRQNLPEYDNVAALLHGDRLPAGKNNDLKAMRDFLPIHNAMMLSRLTFLEGKELNAIAKQAGVTKTSYEGGQPVYGVSDPAGVIMIGSIRSIDGNHQWQPVAPVLPRGNQSVQSLKRATEKTCRRFGYPYKTNYGNDCGEEFPNNPYKGGFRFWIDPYLRQAVFNTLFKGPLSPSLCRAHSKTIREWNTVVGCSDDPFPSSEETSMSLVDYPTKRAP